MKNKMKNKKTEIIGWKASRSFPKPAGKLLEVFVGHPSLLEVGVRPVQIAKEIVPEAPNIHYAWVTL